MDQQKTLILEKLPSTISETELEIHFSNIGPLKRCYILKPKLNSSNSTGYITFTTNKDAIDAQVKIKKIGTHNVFPKFLSKDPNKKNVKNLTKYKKFRLIVRNLSFKTTIKDIKDKFLICGQLNDIQFPKNGTHNQHRGFAFIQFSKLEEAKKAIEILNGSEINGRPIAIDWSVSKIKYQAESLNETKANSAHDENTMYTKVLNSFEEKLDGLKTKHENKNQQIKAYLKIKKTHDKHTLTIDEKCKSTKDSIHDDKTEKHMDQKDLEEKKTLFIRNIPFESTQEDFKKVFERYGSLEYALLLTVNGNEIHKGRGFVKFKTQESATDCLQKANHISSSNAFLESKQPLNDNIGNIERKRAFLFGINEDEELNENTLNFKILDTQKSGFGDNTSTKNGGGIYMRDQRLKVCLAIKRDTLDDIMKRRYDKHNRYKKPLATDLESATTVGEFVNEYDGISKKFKEKDKRNLHLLIESSIKRCSNRYGQISQIDLNKRSKLMASSKSKLKLLHYFVSPTRLTVHNLPKWVDNKFLRRMFQSGVKDHKARIIEARVMMDTKTPLPKSSKSPASMCYGFVEFSTHAHALKALRNLDNNPSAYQVTPNYITTKNADYSKNNGKVNSETVHSTRRPIVQFAISNRLALNARQARQEKAKVTQQRQKAFGAIKFVKNNESRHENKSIVGKNKRPVDDAKPKKKMVDKSLTKKIISNTNINGVKKGKILKSGTKKRSQSGDVSNSLKKPKRIKLNPVTKSSVVESIEDDVALAKKMKKIHHKLFGDAGGQFLDSD
ncbi:unnamed protein product [Gordionus sp. m RMFG-2023]|uniref:RNA-binding protein 28-like n=1 Tax=Gordionus sp. m RMFG-2023 TaxID=3053472 RepID=UPI0030DFED08